MRVLEWRLQNQNVLKDFANIKRLHDEGVLVSSAIATMPTLTISSSLYWNAFDMLSEMRRTDQNGYPEAISMEAIHAYCEMTGMSAPMERDDLLQHVVTLDAHWRNHTILKINEARKRKKPPPPSRRR